MNIGVLALVFAFVCAFTAAWGNKTNEKKMPQTAHKADYSAMMPREI